MIDSSIALGVKPFQIESQANNLANILKLQELQQGGQLNALKLQEAQRGVEQQNNLRSILSGVQPTDTPDAVAQRLMRGGFLNESSKYQQVNRENEMNAAKKREHDLNSAQKANEIAGSIFGAIKANPTPEMVQSGLSYLNSKGILPEKEMQLFMQQYSQAQTPEKIAELAGLHHRSAVPAKDQAPKIDTRNTGGFTETFATDPFSGEVKILNRAQNTQSPDSAASIMATALQGEKNRGQAERHFQQNKAEGQNVYDTERGLIVNKNTGLAKPAATLNGEPLGEKEKPLTEGQSKALLFGSRMENSNKILGDLSAKGVNTAVPLSGGGITGSILNPALNANQQSLSQAKRDFINADLRRESGASIAPSEFDSAERQYFPQVGDTPEVIRQKAENRATAIRGMKAEVPKASQGKFKEVEGSKLSGADAQAAEWAKANPNDPRAAAIKQRLGL